MLKMKFIYDNKYDHMDQRKYKLFIFPYKDLFCLAVFLVFNLKTSSNMTLL